MDWNSAICRRNLSCCFGRLTDCDCRATGEMRRLVDKYPDGFEGFKDEHEIPVVQR